MEDKVEHVLNLIQKDGDSFAKRAEMYYKHRPELISFVEETVRAYRSLAERYDKLSTDLQKANTTIASICPEKVTYDYDDDDDYTDTPKTPKKIHQNTTKIPKTPKPPAKNKKSVHKNASKTIKANPSSDVPKSALTESKTTESQQDEVEVTRVIKKDDAGTLMAENVLKSCEETLDMLQEKQEKLSQEISLEHNRFDETKQKLNSLKHKINPNQPSNNEEENDSKSESNVSNQDDQMEIVSKNPLTVEELGETIDKLVNKMIKLETSVSSQNALTDVLRKETDDLQAQIQKLEEEKASLMNLQSRRLYVVTKDDVSWQKMLLNGFEDKDNILLEEYITILKSYKDTKKKLSEEEKRNHGILSLMKSAIAKRDYKIQMLKEKLKHLQETFGEDKVDIPSVENDDDIIIIDEPQVVSGMEEKLRMNIDELLDENLEFWLRFSDAFRQVYKFKKQVKDLQEELRKVKVKGLAGKSSTSMFTTDIISDVKPIYKHLKGINTELTTWLEQSTLLKDELKMRCSYLNNIREKITQALREGVEEEEIKFSTHHAAKFQSEILNMKQENNKVNEELQAGLDHAIALKLEIEKTIERLEKEFGFFNNQNQPPKVKGKSTGRSVMTLRSFLFGGKSKKQKMPSCFSCIGHHKKNNAHKSGRM